MNEKKKKQKEKQRSFRVVKTYMAGVNAVFGVSQEDVLDASKVETVGSNVTDISESSNQLLGLFTADLITMTVTSIGK